jgi:hypothetical protein
MGTEAKVIDAPASLTTQASDVPGMFLDMRTVEAALKARAMFVERIRGWMGTLLRPDHDFGIPEGSGIQKPFIYKSGCETLALGTRTRFEYVSREERELTGDHMEAIYVMRLVDATGFSLGEGVGSCSTREAKYRFRKAARKCPNCSKEAIIKGKAEYGGGWLCFGKKGGCGAKFKEGDASIEKQEVGLVENENPADARNTVRKMASIRAMRDVTCRALGVSDLFSQDEDAVTGEVHDPAARDASAPPDDGWDRRTQNLPPEVAKRQRVEKKAQSAPAPPPPPDVASTLDQLGKIRKEVSDLMGSHAGHEGVPRDEKGRFVAAAYGEFVKRVVSAAIGKTQPEHLDDWATLKAWLSEQIAARLDAVKDDLDYTPPVPT